MGNFLLVRSKILALTLLICLLLSLAVPVLAQDVEGSVPVTGVTLDQEELILMVGDKPGLLVATIEPEDATDKGVIWSSSDETVATVVYGSVTPLTVGETTISVTTVDSGFKASCEVIVKGPGESEGIEGEEEAEPKEIPITGVLLDQANLDLMVGDIPVLLTAILEPEDATEQSVIWLSSDESVATVEDGLVAPISAGTITVSVTTVDGGYTAICAVTVNELPVVTVPVTGVLLNESELILTVNGPAENLFVTIEPADATNQEIIWASSDDNIATVNDGIVVPIAPGTATISATTGDGRYTATCEVIVNEVEIQLREILVGANEEHPLVCSSSDGVTVDYAANADGSYEWYYSEEHSSEGYNAYLAGNSGTSIANVSNIGLEVTGPGVLSFDYMTDTYSSGKGYALYYNEGTPITADNYTSAINYDRVNSFKGKIDWTKEEYNILTKGTTTIYIAYLRLGSNASSTENRTVALANICFTSGQKVLTLAVDGEDYGHVTDADNHTYSESENTLFYESGDIVKLTAVPEEGARFYGWVDGKGKFLTTDETYSFMISSDTRLKAVFAADGYYAAHRNGKFYTDNEGGLAKALADAQPGDIISMLENQTLSEDATVPSDAILYIPYSATFDPNGNADGSKEAGLYIASTKMATDAKTYRTLTIDSDVTLTINGTLNVGSVISYPGQYYQGHTSGWHGRIENNGDIVIGSGGMLDCWGLITGAGTVTAENGASVYEPFIVYDFAGGWNTAELYFANQSPFKQYAMQNIQTELILNPSSWLHGHCNLYALDVYNKTDIVFIGEEGLFKPANGASVIRTYDGSKFSSTNTDIGKTTYTFNGGMAVDHLSMEIMSIVTVSTEDVEFPISYNIDLVLENGDYYPGRLKLMPGASMWVEEDASLIVDGIFYVLDGLVQSDMSGKSYPSTATLQGSGLSASGQLFINGTMLVKEGATFGGIIQTETGRDHQAAVTIQAGAIVNSKNVQDGAVGAYDVNTAIFDLPARAYIYNSDANEYALMGLCPGMACSSHDKSAFTVDNYTMTYAVNCEEAEASSDIPEVSTGFHKWAVVTIPLDETRIGSWVTDAHLHAVNVMNTSIYDAQDSSRATVNAPEAVADGGDFVFNIATTEAGKGYVHLVTYTSGNDDQVVLTPDAEGNYTVSNVHGEVGITVTSCKLGDVTLNGVINMLDLLELSKIIAEINIPTPIQQLAANTNRDSAGRVNLLDLLQLQKYLGEYITEFE